MKNESSRTAWCFNSCWAQEREVGHKANHPSTGPRDSSGATARSQARHETLPQRPGSRTPVFLLLMLDMIFPRVLLQGWINFYEADCYFIIHFHSRWVQRAGKLSSRCQPALLPKVSAPSFGTETRAAWPWHRTRNKCWRSYAWDGISVQPSSSGSANTHGVSPFHTGTESKPFSV